MTTYATGAPNFSGDPANFTPVVKYVQTSVTYPATGNGLFVVRSNATTAMTDTIAAVDPSVDATGWNFYIHNADASASITLTPTTGTINGASTLTITAGTTVRIVWDSLNKVYWV
jgi:hypothetical protein